MYQIQYGFFKSKGKYICLLDGDDKFSNLKLNNLSKIFGQTKNKIVQDVPYLFSNTFKKKSKIKSIKIIFFLKKFLLVGHKFLELAQYLVVEKYLINFLRRKTFLLELFSYRYKINIICSHTI